MSQRVLAYVGLLVAMLMATLDGSVVSTALPTVVGDLGGLRHIAWVGTVYLLAQCVSMPLYGKLGDLFGRKPVFLVALGLFLAGSIACAAATSMTQLIAFRGVQGLGGGGLMVSAFAIVGELFEPRERARYAGYGAGVFALSSVAGPLVGGVLTDHASWRWIFLINLPIGAVAIVMAVLFLHLTERRPARIDIGGIVLLGAGLSCVLLAVGRTSFVLGLVGAALIGLWVAVERRVVAPVVPLRLFGNRTFSLSGVVALCSGFTGFGLVLFVPLYLQISSDASATGSGLLLLPMMAGLIVAALLAGRIVSATGRYKWLPVASMAITIGALALLSTMDARTGRIESALYLVVLGVGSGLAQQVPVVAVQSAAPRSDLGAATSTVTLARILGTALGTAVLGAVLTARLHNARSITPVGLHSLAPAARDAVRDAYAHAISGVFWAAIPVAVLGLIAALGLPDIRLAGGQPAPVGDSAKPTMYRRAKRLASRVMRNAGPKPLVTGAATSHAACGSGDADYRSDRWDRDRDRV